MTEARSFCSTLAPFIRDYLQLKRALGRGYTHEEHILRLADSFLARTGSDLTSDSFVQWCLTQHYKTSGVRRNQMRVVRNLCLYRRRREPNCFVPDLSEFPPLHQPVRPYIFTESEIASLIRVADTLKSTTGCPLRRETFRLAIVLLYTTGMRRGEVLDLRISDYDPHENTVLIRESKFHKSRLLALSADGVREIEAYLEARRHADLPASADCHLLWNRYKGGKGYTGTGLSDTLKKLFRLAGIRKPTGKPPRVHDLRFTFAAHALMRWYRSGAGLRTKLPFLATYMGHVSIVSTEYYLRFSEDRLAAATDRFAQRCSALVTVEPTGGGNAFLQ
jgi:integrase/recombinase XerD